MTWLADSFSNGGPKGRFLKFDVGNSYIEEICKKNPLKHKKKDFF